MVAKSLDRVDGDQNGRDHIDHMFNSVLFRGICRLLYWHAVSVTLIRSAVRRIVPHQIGEVFIAHFLII